MNPKIYDHLHICLKLWFTLYGVCLFIGKLMFDFYQTLILLGITFAGIWCLQIPPVGKRRVLEVLGQDPVDKEDGSFMVKTVSHRGCGLDAPENSIAAFNYVISKGIRLIELDLCMTKDNVLVISHDDSLLRVTGDCRFISNTTWHDLQDIDIAINHPLRERFPNCRIPTLDETLKSILVTDTRIIVDLKVSSAIALNQLLKKFKENPKMYDRVAISGFNPFALYRIRRSDPNIVISMAYRPFFFSYCDYTVDGPMNQRYDNFFVHKCSQFLDFLWDIWFPFVASSIIGVNLMLLHKDIISQEVIRYWRTRNVRVMAWTVNQPYEKIWYARGLKTTYLTDTLIGENTAHNTNLNISNGINNGSILNNSN